MQFYVGSNELLEGHSLKRMLISSVKIEIGFHVRRAFKEISH